MTKETVFELIRKEDAVLWLGAGMSIYSGYPSGNQLSKNLLASLSANEKRTIYSNSLSDIAEEIERLRGRNFLINELKNIFQKLPISLSNHEILKRIPHIKTIVTTNYDNLIEKAYCDEMTKIVDDVDVAYTTRNKPDLIKIHGDLAKPSSIIITKSDYKRFYYNNINDSLIWAMLKERIATKSVVFIGYSFEDLNIEILFDKVSEILSIHKKPAYLIAPKLSREKVHWLSRKGIKYLNFKADVFLSKLFDDLKKNIREDFEVRKYISFETFSKFLENFKLNALIETKNDDFKIKQIAGEMGASQILRFNINSKDNEFDLLKQIANGQSFEPLEIDGNKIKNLELRINDFDILPSKAKDLKLIFNSNPKFEKQVDVCFENGFDIRNLNIKLFASNKLSEVYIKSRSSHIKISYQIANNDLNQIDFKFQQEENFKTVNAAIEIFKFIIYLTSGIKFSVYESVSQNYYDSLYFPEGKLPEDVYNQLKYYETLREVEIKYRVRFTDLSPSTNEYFQAMTTLLNHYEGQAQTYSSNAVFECTFEGDITEINKTINNTEALRITVNDFEEVEIHNQRLPLGYKVIEILNPRVMNLNEYLEGIHKTLNIESKIGKYKIHYRGEIDDVDILN